MYQRKSSWTCIKKELNKEKSARKRERIVWTIGYCRRVFACPLIIAPGFGLGISLFFPELR